jgi:hypothetical protein
VTAAAEGAGKLILNQGLTSSFRPRKYYTLPKETVEGILEDLEQLADFFLIEFQRILFAENVLHTAAVSPSIKILETGEINLLTNNRLSSLPSYPTGSSRSSLSGASPCSVQPSLTLDL